VSRRSCCSRRRAPEAPAVRSTSSSPRRGTTTRGSSPSSPRRPTPRAPTRAACASCCSSTAPATPRPSAPRPRAPRAIPARASTRGPSRSPVLSRPRTGRGPRASATRSTTRAAARQNGPPAWGAAAARRAGRRGDPAARARTRRVGDTSTQARFFVGDLLPEARRAIYLDADVVVEASLAGLDGAAAAAFAANASAVVARAAKESEIPNFKGSYLGRFPLVLADSWTSDHLSERSRSVDALFGTRARGTLTLKRR